MRSKCIVHESQKMSSGSEKKYEVGGGFAMRANLPRRDTPTATKHVTHASEVINGMSV